MSTAAISVLAALLGLITGTLICHQRQRKSREDAQRLAMRYERILRGTGAGTWEWDLESGETHINERWANMLGYRPEELMPVTLERMEGLLHPDDVERSREAVHRHLRGEAEYYELDVRLRHREGRWVWVNDCGRVMSWTEDGRAAWMFGIHIDITTRHRLEEQRDAWARRFRDLSDNVPGALFQFCASPDGKLTFPFFSENGLNQLLGISAEQLRENPRKLLAIMPPEDRRRAQARLHEKIPANTVVKDHFRLQHPTRGQVWLESSATRTQQEDGSILWHGYLQDITELMQAREQLKLDASVFEASLDAIFITDEHNHFVQVNGAFQTMTGYTLADLRNTSPTQILSTPHAPELIDQIGDFLKARDSWRHEVTVVRKSGDSFPADLTVTTVRDSDGHPSHHVAVFSDISAQKAHEAELDRIAHFDPLTGIPNRRLLTDRMEQAIAQACRTGERLAVIMLDLDGFKPVNDGWGHEAGDTVLVEIAHRLKQLLRAEDTVARLGGDEFVLLLRHAATNSACERVLEAIRRPVVLQDDIVQVSASLGLAWFEPETPVDGDQLLRMADQAAYQAKAAGKNCFVVFTKNDDSTVRPAYQTSST